MKTQFKIVGYYSFKLRKVFATKSLLQIAEQAITDKLNRMKEIAIKVIKGYKDFAQHLIKNVKPSFRRWSDLQECLLAIREEKNLLPKAIRNTLNYSIR